MRYEARITAYDMLDKVTVAATLWATDPNPAEKLEPILRTVVTVQGEGESRPAIWLRDALCALAETL